MGRALLVVLLVVSLGLCAVGCKKKVAPVEGEQGVEVPETKVPETEAPETKAPEAPKTPDVPGPGK